MSLYKDVPSSFLIAPDLLHDPRANYLPWKEALFKIAASQLPTLFVSGCLFLVQNQSEYDTFPLHVVSGSVIAPPTLTPPTPPVAGDTTLQREAFARALASHEALVLVRARLKTAIIASILPADLLALRDPLQFRGMSRRRTFWCGRPRCLRNCPRRQTFSSTWHSSPKGTRRFY